MKEVKFKSCFRVAKLVLVLFISSSMTNAQVQYSEDIANARSLEITFNKTTSLIFPVAIKNVDRGSRDVLAQKAKGVENVLQLKAARANFQETNLTVITANGRLHHFTVNYAQYLRVLTVEIKEEESIGEAMSHPVIFRSVMEPDMEKHAKAILESGKTKRLISHQKYKIRFSLQGIYIRDDAIFYHLKVKNLSDIDYDIDFLRFYITDRQKVKRTALQEIEVKPVYVYGNPNLSVRGKSDLDLVYVLEKFTIPDAKRLNIEMFEKNGGRHMNLSVKNKTIIKAKQVPER